jgi:uncharacterized radical SAM superfamily Fe-S cluster-containing enzyme
MTFDLQIRETPAGDSEQPAVSVERYGTGAKLKDTISICPRCLDRVSASVFERSDGIWLDKRCSRHGRFSALLSSNRRHYYAPRPAPESGTTCCGSACGIPSVHESDAADSAPWTNHSCTVLIEIIDRCNLSCPTCFAGSSPQRSEMMCLEEFERQVDRLASGGKTGADMIQLSGGEPTIHPQLFDMIRLLFRRGFKQVCINSNGIRLARADFADRLAECMRESGDGRIYIYLQFDGFDDRTQLSLRGREDLLELKQRALANCLDSGLSVHPVMTLTRGINDHEVGDFIRLAVENPELKNVVIQPAMYSGRYDHPRRRDRITLSDTVEMICSQSDVFRPDDFGPIPCSDPNCFSIGVAMRTRGGLLPLSRYFPSVEQWGEEEARDLIERFSDTINGPQAISEAIRWATSGDQLDRALQDLDPAELDDLLSAMIEHQERGGGLWDSLLTVSIKPFMDAWTYDQDRIDQCCVHILDKSGNPVSFCEFNAVNRPRLMEIPKSDV